jgi:hypothetical protein
MSLSSLRDSVVSSSLIPALKGWAIFRRFGDGENLRRRFTVPRRAPERRALPTTRKERQD